MLLPCRNCGSLTLVTHRASDPPPLLCDHCKQTASLRAAVAPATTPRKRAKRGRVAPAETYDVPKKRKK